MYTKEDYENAKKIVQECEKQLDLSDVMFSLADLQKRVKQLECDSHKHLVERPKIEKR